MYITAVQAISWIAFQDFDGLKKYFEADEKLFSKWCASSFGDLLFYLEAIRDGTDWTAENFKDDCTHHRQELSPEWVRGLITRLNKPVEELILELSVDIKELTTAQEKIETAQIQLLEKLLAETLSIKGMSGKDAVSSTVVPRGILSKVVSEGYKFNLYENKFFTPDNWYDLHLEKSSVLNLWPTFSKQSSPTHISAWDAFHEMLSDEGKWKNLTQISLPEGQVAAYGKAFPNGANYTAIDAYFWIGGWIDFETRGNDHINVQANAVNAGGGIAYLDVKFKRKDLDAWLNPTMQVSDIQEAAIQQNIQVRNTLRQQPYQELIHNIAIVASRYPDINMADFFGNLSLIVAQNPTVGLMEILRTESQLGDASPRNLDDFKRFVRGLLPIAQAYPNSGLSEAIENLKKSAFIESFETASGGVVTPFNPVRLPFVTPQQVEDYMVEIARNSGGVIPPRDAFERPAIEYFKGQGLTLTSNLYRDTRKALVEKAGRLGLSLPKAGKKTKA